MLSRTVSRAVVESPWRLPPTFLLPLRARMSTSTTTMSSAATSSQPSEREPPPPSTLSSSAPAHTTSATEAIRAAQTQQTSPTQSIPSSSSAATTAAASPTSSSIPTSEGATPAPPAPKEPLSESVTSLLSLLVSQPPHYATVHIHARAYLVTEGDVVRLPYRMPEVTPGDVLRLNRASLVGSRDFTLKGQPYVDERLFECRAVVVGVEAEPMRFKEKTKRRNRKVKTVKSKHRYTEVVIKELKVKKPEEVEV